MKPTFIIPCLLLAVFALYHHSAADRTRAKEAAQAAQTAEKKAAEAQHRLEIQRATFEQARLAAATREQQERERVEKKQAAYDAAMATIEAETAAHTSEADRLAAEAGDLTRQLADLRATKTRLEREAAEATRTAELRRIERRNADFEIQSAATRMLARLNESLDANQGRF